LEKSIGSRGRVSEVLNGQRALTLAMIRKLNKNLNIPAEVLIQDFKKNSLIVNWLFPKSSPFQNL
jgi:HTH-type transcriptional regulator/antitoxin HigA